MFTKSTIKYLILSVILLAVAVGLTAYLWLDLKISGTELKANVQVIEDQAFLSKEEIRLNTLLEETEAERQNLNRFVLADESAAVDFLSEIDLVARQLGLSVETSNLHVLETKEAGFDELITDFIFTGSESAVLTMLSYLESLSYSSSVNSVQLMRSGGVTILNVSLDLSIREND